MTARRVRLPEAAGDHEEWLARAPNTAEPFPASTIFHGSTGADVWQQIGPRAGDVLDLGDGYRGQGCFFVLPPVDVNQPEGDKESKPLEGGANGDPCGGMRLVANKDLSASGYLSVPQEAAAVFDDALAAYKPLEDEWTHLELPPSDPLVAALLKRPDGRLRKLKPGVHLIVGGDPAERTLFVTRNENKDLLGEVPVGDLEKASWLADVACLPSSAE